MKENSFASKWHPLYLLLKILLFLVAILPKSFLSFFADLLGRLACKLAKKDTRIIQQNIKRVMDLAPHSEFSKLFVRQVFRHQAVSLMETIREIAVPGSIEVSGLCEYQRLVEDAKKEHLGVVIVTAHLGSWELVARYGAQVAKDSFYALAKPSKYSAVSRFLDDLRPRMGTKVLWTNKASLLKDMMSALKTNKLLGFVMDQKPDERVGHDVDFLGLKTCFVSGPARLALKKKSPIIGVFCVREGPWHYRIICEKIESDIDKQNQEVFLTQRMADVISRNIKLYPEQWVWNYRRWQSLPLG